MKKRSARETLVIGTVTGVFGLRGDVKVEVAAFALEPGLEAEVEGPFVKRRMMRVAKVRPARGHLRVRFEGVDDAAGAEQLRGAAIRATRAALPELGPNTFLESELVGMEVVDRALGALGRVAGIARYPACDMLVVGERRMLVPMLAAYRMLVDRATHTITTELPAGFDELL